MLRCGSPRRKCPSECPLRVKTGKAQCEHMFSALPPKADVAQRGRHVRKVPLAEVASPLPRELMRRCAPAPFECRVAPPLSARP